MLSPKRRIPDRWLNYCPVGRRIPGTRFIAFKVPFKESLNRQLPESDSFSLWDLLDSVESQNQELGLIIDLTFTTKYYELTDVPQSCFYTKIFTKGHQVPSNATILSFKQAVRRFLKENQDNDKLIGVHCTHGLNRTGYLVCRYLIDVDGFDPLTALELFNSCRGHCIERKNYLRDLQSAAKRSNDAIDHPQQAAARGLAVERPPQTTKQDQRPPQTTRQDQRPPQTTRQDQRPPQTTKQDQRLPQTTRQDQTPPQTTRPLETRRQNQSLLETTRQDQRLPQSTRQDRRPPETTRLDQTPPQTTRRDQRPPQTSRQDQRPPQTTRQDQRPPQTSRQDQRPPQTTRQDQRPPQTTRQDQRTPQITRQGQKPPQTTRQNARPPLTTRQDTRPLETTRQNQSPLETTRQDQRVPQTTRQDRRPPQTTRQNQRPPQTTRQDQRPPLTTRQDQRPPQTSRQDQRPPQTTRQEQRLPQTTRQDQRPPQTTRQEGQLLQNITTAAEQDGHGSVSDHQEAAPPFRDDPVQTQRPAGNRHKRRARRRRSQVLGHTSSPHHMTMKPRPPSGSNSCSDY
ncbi:basic salivary proline-rich protein 1-like [Acanthochromis polyacanthus]|uniref:basic salivary proline-rich protein 1-like n=1 Tax=Acanthochromis polyacanthus TaxID=80966 RepID=UPI0022345DB1|nr:basic salivary proline-rich protein 1-like [Acanthochromis polyacanthus]XP_022061426.2 basic salivary proline-rich protein 1-like [Acanthochromis polyacanthus]